MKIKDQLQQTIKLQGKSPATFKQYWFWIEKFILFAKKKRGHWVHPKNLREKHVEIFLTHLANHEKVSENTQNVAFSALCYLYKHIIKEPLVGVSALRSKRPDTIREVLDQSEIRKLFENLSGPSLLAANLIYGCSLRISEVGNLRIKDLSFEREQIAVKRGKGNKDRIVKFPKPLHSLVTNQIESMRILWESDCRDRLNGVSLPNRYGVKCPSARLDFAWWYLFTADNYSKDPETGKLYRHHQDMGHIGRNIKTAAIKCGFAKRITSHCLRHSFATHSLENGVPIHVVQELMGHNSLETTERYIHLCKKGVTSYQSPIESL